MPASAKIGDQNARRMHADSEGQVDGWQERDATADLGHTAAAAVWQVASQLHRTRPRPPRCPITYTAKMDAEHWLAVERRSIERDEWTAPRLRAEAQRARSERFGEYATDWLETRSLKPRTKIGYEASYNNYIKGKLEDVPLSALNAETVRRWYAAMDKAKPTARGARLPALARGVRDRPHRWPVEHQPVQPDASHEHAHQTTADHPRCWTRSPS